MKRLYDNSLLLSPTDISDFMHCHHKTQLNLLLLKGKIAEPKGGDPYAAIVRQLGDRHEKEYVDFLRRQGRQVIDVRSQGQGKDQFERTLNAMQQGVEIIIQAQLRRNDLNGYADILYRVDRPGIWDWSYEVGDTKLAQTTKGASILQLCMYADMLEDMQGVAPEYFYIIKPGQFDEPEVFRFDHYSAYYRYVQRALTDALQGGSMETYPDPVAHCDVCRWWKVCEDRRRDDDHLSLIAGIQRGHVKLLHEAGIGTLAEYAGKEKAFEGQPSRGKAETFERLHQQAQIQHRGRQTNSLIYRLLPNLDLSSNQPRTGLARLPEPSPGDIFFDIESDRFHENGSLEYLLGIVFKNEGVWTYKPFWGLDRKTEKSAFEALMAFLTERLELYPDFHIYHYSPYEPSALKHLMLRHSTCTEEVDWFLRAERFIDLYAIVKQSLFASVESYGLKDLEPFYNFERKTPLRDASLALLQIQRALELNIQEGISPVSREIVQKYNMEDCLSTLALCDWLEERRMEYIEEFNTIERPALKTGDTRPEQAEKLAKTRMLFESLLSRLPEDESLYTDEDRAIHLLAYLLAYFERESKNNWWEYFSRQDIDDDDLLTDRKAVVGLSFVREIPLEGRQSAGRHVYTYPVQEVSPSSGDFVYDIDCGDIESAKIGVVVDFNLTERTITIKKTKQTGDRHPMRIQFLSQYPTTQMENAILEIAECVISKGINALRPTTKALLMRTSPRLKNDERLGSEALASAIHACQQLNHSVLPLQGPPGTGKTFTGAHMILSLLAKGMRIGITAVGHKVIDNLLERIANEAAKKNISVELYHYGKEPQYPPQNISYINKNQALNLPHSGAVLGATVFHWASPQCIDTLDYLFIDEAGQMSLAYVLAASRCAQNLVLLGDPQQLEQPQKAAHPEGSDVSALSHYMGGNQTIDPDHGIFLDTTWRLHPLLCNFTSELYYDRKLKSLPNLAKQVLKGRHRFAGNASSGNPGAGLYFVPVEHTGNCNVSHEEIKVIRSIIRELLEDGNTWTFANKDDIQIRNLTTRDILVIAPFNAQVTTLITAMADIPGLEIGTVDKFQGREAAVVIYSMASSTVEDAPRGMSFIFAPNRLNVASSRARCAFILVASPNLFEADCHTPAQMQWANGMCRFREVAMTIAV